MEIVIIILIIYFIFCLVPAIFAFLVDVFKFSPFIENLKNKQVLFERLSLKKDKKGSDGK